MYTSYYGFTAKPFQLSPDPRFFFGSTGHKRAMAYLRYGLGQGEGFIVITGGIGTGKTTLARSLFSELDTGDIVAAQLVTTQIEADDLMRMVAGAFGLAAEGGNKASIIKRFEDFLRDNARDGKRVLLVVDEAQNLPAKSLEELRMLSNFQVFDRPLLQSFLLGQEEFRATLQTPGMEQLRQRVIASCHLSPLSRAETREYIEHRLRVVGWSGTPHFSDDAYGAIYAHTRGIPRRVNVFCDRILLFGFLEELSEIDADAVRSVGKELFQEAGGEEEQGTEAAAPPAAPGTPDATSEDLDRRMQELERAVAALTLRPGAGDANGEVHRVGKRLAELEPVVESLQQGLVELSGLVQRVLAASDK